MKKRITLSKLMPDMWKHEHIEAMNVFLGPLDSYPCLLTAYIDNVSGLVFAESVPYGSVGEMVYFIRRRASPSEGESTEPHVTVESFYSEIQYGVVSGRHIESLLRIMTGVYVPMFFRNTTWPDRCVLLTHSSCDVVDSDCDCDRNTNSTDTMQIRGLY